MAAARPNIPRELARHMAKDGAGRNQMVHHLRGEHRPLIVMGDFNCGWFKEDALRFLIEHLHLHVYEPQSRELPTYRSNRPRRRVDWILASKHFEFVNYEVWPDRVSDHLAVAADLRWLNNRGTEGR